MPEMTEQTDQEALTAAIERFTYRKFFGITHGMDIVIQRAHNEKWTVGAIMAAMGDGFVKLAVGGTGRDKYVCGIQYGLWSEGGVKASTRLSFWAPTPLQALIAAQLALLLEGEG